MSPGNEQDNMEPADTQNWMTGFGCGAHVQRGNGGVPAVSIDPETGDIPKRRRFKRQAQSERGE
jgi:hypothetical protein